MNTKTTLPNNHKQDTSSSEKNAQGNNHEGQAKEGQRSHNTTSGDKSSPATPQNKDRS